MILITGHSDYLTFNLLIALLRCRFQGGKKDGFYLYFFSSSKDLLHLNCYVFSACGLILCYSTNFPLIQNTNGNFQTNNCIHPVGNFKLQVCIEMRAHYYFARLPAGHSLEVGVVKRSHRGPLIVSEALQSSLITSGYMPVAALRLLKPMLSSCPILVSGTGDLFGPALSLCHNTTLLGQLENATTA